MIWGIGSYLFKPKSHLENEQLPLYLYDNDKLNDLQILTSHSTYKFFIKQQLTRFSLDERNFFKDINKPKFKIFNREENLQKLADSLIDKRKSYFKHLSKEKSFNAIDQYILPIIKSNQTTNFYIFFPPRSLYHKLSEDPKYTLMRKDLVLKLSPYKNVRIYGFDTVKEITHNLNNYFDSSHYHPKFDNYILESIANNNHQLTVKNIDAYINKIIEQIRNYKVNSNGRVFKAISKEKKSGSNFIAKADPQ
ncbi:hypothetical protein AAEX28_07385 [Lentisphaerota bacterium WC36G]|nr:hypothetical protein LJT99_10245 [Lentisphaerae bacterium WC36]